MKFHRFGFLEYFSVFSNYLSMSIAFFLTGFGWFFYTLWHIYKIVKVNTLHRFSTSQSTYMRTLSDPSQTNANILQIGLYNLQIKIRFKLINVNLISGLGRFRSSHLPLARDDTQGARRNGGLGPRSVLRHALYAPGLPTAWTVSDPKILRPGSLSA